MAGPSVKPVEREETGKINLVRLELACVSIPYPLALFVLMVSVSFKEQLPYVI